MRVLGIDPGLNHTGFAVLEGTAAQPRILEAGIITPSKTTKVLEQRLQILFQEINALIVDTQPTVMSIEQLFSHYKHPRTAILMGHARGVLLLAAAHANISVYHYLPKQVKSFITGSGNAGKQQMQLAMMNQLHLPQLPEPHDVADALALALCHLASPLQRGLHKED